MSNGTTDKGEIGLIDISSISANVNSNETPNKFTITLNNPLLQVRYLRLEMASIPYNFYPVWSNASIPLSETGHATIFIPIPQGGYSYTQFATLLATLLTTNSPSSSTYTVTFNENTEQYTFVSNGPTFAFLWTLTRIRGNNAYQLLGFNQLIWNPDTGYASTQVSTGKVLMNEGFIYIGINQIGTNIRGFTDLYKTFEIPITANFGSTINYFANTMSDKQQIQYYNRGISISQLNISWLHSDGLLLDSAGHNKIIISYELWPPEN